MRLLDSECADPLEIGNMCRIGRRRSVLWGTALAGETGNRCIHSAAACPMPTFGCCETRSSCSALVGRGSGEDNNAALLPLWSWESGTAPGHSRELLALGGHHTVSCIAPSFSSTCGPRAIKACKAEWQSSQRKQWTFHFMCRTKIVANTKTEKDLILSPMLLPAVTHLFECTWFKSTSN